MGWKKGWCVQSMAGIARAPHSPLAKLHAPSTHTEASGNVVGNPLDVDTALDCH